MKADSSPLVYIIISIVLFIFSAIGKANKKAAGNRPPVPNPMDEPAPTGLPKEFEEIFGKIYGEDTQKEKESEIVYEEAKSSEVIPSQKYNTEYESLEVINEEAASLENSEIRENQIKTHPELVSMDEAEQRNEFAQNFEPRKAIIYAEIINRKYF